MPHALTVRYVIVYLRSCITFSAANLVRKVRIHVWGKAVRGNITLAARSFSGIENLFEGVSDSRHPGPGARGGDSARENARQVFGSYW